MELAWDKEGIKNIDCERDNVYIKIVSIVQKEGGGINRSKKISSDGTSRKKIELQHHH